MTQEKFSSSLPVVPHKPVLPFRSFKMNVCLGWIKVTAVLVLTPHSVII